jgi:ADP-ribosyl-[dinitrogen reductase] hydrolase
VNGVRDRAEGSLLGLALGDALGAPFESRRSHAVPEPLPAFELPWMGKPAGSWTDDTAMARNLVRSLVARGGLDTNDLLERHLAWFAGGPPGLGHQTRLVLAEAAAGTPEPARAVFELRGPEVSAGNGSVMYCAPLGVAFAQRPDDLHRLAPTLSKVTHWDARCSTACLAVTVAVAGLVRGEAGEQVVVNAVSAVRGLEGAEELEHLVEAAGTVRPVDGPDRGFVLFTAGIALRQAARARGFEESLREVVALGGDTDTNGAVTGALLGALHGRSALPDGWLAKLADREAIERETEALAELAERQ